MAGSIAVYPGSFDPITNGHVDIIERSIHVFDRLIVAVASNPKKIPLFSTKERVEIIKEIFAGKDKIIVEAFDGLLVDFLRKKGVGVVVRGLRAISDFEYEFQMAITNRKISKDVETFFMMASESYSYLSSMIVKEVASLGGSIHSMVPDEVEKRLMEKYRP